MSNPFLNWTQSDVDAHNARVAGSKNLPTPQCSSGETQSRPFPARAVKVMESAGQHEDRKGAGHTLVKPPMRHGPTLNKLERDWLAVLERRYSAPEDRIYSQSFRVRLADQRWYKPDFMTTNGASITFWETKGPHRFKREGILKIRVAAEHNRWANWILVTRENGQWKEQQV